MCTGEAVAAFKRRETVNLQARLSLFKELDSFHDSHNQHSYKERKASISNASRHPPSTAVWIYIYKSKEPVNHISLLVTTAHAPEEAIACVPEYNKA